MTGERRLTLTAMAEISAAEGELPKFTLDAYTGGLMRPFLSGVYWDGPVIISLSGLRRTTETIPVHRDHDRSRPVGHGTVEVAKHVTVHGFFSIENEDSREILNGSRNGFPWKASVGLSNMIYEIVEEGRTVEVNGETYSGPLLHVIEGDLDEVSFVTIAGDPNVSPAIAANKGSGATTMNFSQWLAANGWDESKLTDAQKAQLKISFEADQKAQTTAEAPAQPEQKPTEPTAASTNQPEAQQTADPAPVTQPEAQPNAPVTAASATVAAGRGGVQSQQLDPSVAQLRASQAAEENRIAAIREIGETIGNPQVEGGATLTAHAIAQGWDANRTALYATRNSRPQAPSIHTTSPAQRGSTEALQAGIMLRAGRQIDQVLPDHHSIPGWMSRPVNDPERQRVMNDAQEFRDLEMVDYIAHGLQAMGHSRPAGSLGRSGRLTTLQAGFSTGATAAVFTQSVGAIALATYMESGDFSQGWTSESDVPNLMETDRPRMQSGQDLTLHETGGEADHSSRSANNEKVKADRFSRSCEIDENDFINDRFQMLRDTPVEFGRAASRLRPNMVAAVLLANASLSDGTALFHSDHNNLLTGSALAPATLRAARSALGKQKDGDSSLNLPATHLLVPTDLGDLGIQLTMSAIITNDSGNGGMNPLRSRNIQSVEEARLANGVVNPLTKASLAGSLTRWFLISAEGHTIEVQFLEGTGRMPQVIVTQLTGGKFGLHITVKHFIGAKALDYRGMVRADA